MSISAKYAIWKDRKYIDLWTVNHIIAGTLLGYAVLFLKLSLTSGIVISLVLIIGWEFLERLALQVEETWQNGVIDVILGLLGFMLIWSIYPYLETGTHTVVFLVLLVFWLIIELVGLFAYRRLRSQTSFKNQNETETKFHN